MKNLILIFVVSQILMGCEQSGFSLKSNPADNSTSEKKAVQAGVEDTVKTLSLNGGQPGAISLSGVVIKSEKGHSQVVPQISVEQSVGKNSLGESANEVKVENKLSFEPADTSYLSPTSAQKDFLQIGCSSQQINISSFINGLAPGKMNLELKESIDIKAKVVVLCKKLDLAQSFISITADHLVLIDLDHEISNPNGVGTFSVVSRKLTLIGQNRILSRGRDSSSAIIDGPTILLAVDKELAGSGKLELKAIGGNRLSANRK